MPQHAVEVFSELPVTQSDEHPELRTGFSCLWDQRFAWSNGCGRDVISERQVMQWKMNKRRSDRR